MKRLARYLKRERQWGQVFLNGKTVEEVTTFTDSDWAGCKETRKSSSAGVVMLGEHASKAYTRKQKIIARSSAVGRVARIVTPPMRSKPYKSELLSQAEADSKRVRVERKLR